MNIALVLAGGSGSRMENDLPKQFMNLANKPVILYSLDAFQAHPLIDEIYVVCHPMWIRTMNEILQKATNLSKLQTIVEGGESRKQSSYHGLLEIAKNARNDDIVLIHDAARPNLSQKIISDNITSACQNNACATAVAVSDTMFLSNDGTLIEKVPNRSAFYSAQTPQSFRLETILNAHQAITDDSSITDDAGLLIKLNVPVCIVEGDKTNIKLTTKEDFETLKVHMRL